MNITHYWIKSFFLFDNLHNLLATLHTHSHLFISVYRLWMKNGQNHDHHHRHHHHHHQSSMISANVSVCLFDSVFFDTQKKTQKIIETFFIFIFFGCGLSFIGYVQITIGDVNVNTKNTHRYRHTRRTIN